MAGPVLVPMAGPLTSKKKTRKQSYNPREFGL